MKETHSHKFRVKGTISMYGRIMDKNVDAITVAPSEKKAIGNVMYKWKDAHGLDPKRVKTEFDGTAEILETYY